MSWIDEARKRRAEASESEARAAKQLEAERIKQLNLFAAARETILPRGVEIVGAFFSDRPEVSYLIPAVRVDLGNGAQFDLELGCHTVHGVSTHHGGACDGYYTSKPDRTGMNLSAYEVGGPILSVIRKTVWGRPSPDHFSKTEVEDLLFNALEKHDAKRASA
jgi:hypothetical protein